MDEDLSSYGPIVIEKKLIAQDPKQVEFSSKFSAVIYELDGKNNGHEVDKFQKKNKHNNHKHNSKKTLWKCKAPKVNESKDKEANVKHSISATNLNARMKNQCGRCTSRTITKT